ncbi:MAG: ribosomal L7Ae/L30e/S12e/Gadd45 family protein [Candidatus Cloacimonetes bacterium]|nr:ribosomal L7Ae/L30e/S12e/Gadd45 family protein [Candidatus Cloacimonadota bacterium]
MAQEMAQEEKVELEKISSLLHLARRAGKLILGTAASEQSLKRKKAKLCILAEDISERTKRNIIRISGDVPIFICATKAKLGAEFNRNELGIIIVEDGNFAHGIMRRLK